MVKYILLLLSAALIVVPGQSLPYDTSNVYSESDTSTIRQFLSELRNKSKNGNRLNGRSLPPPKEYNWNSFHSLNETNTWMLSLTSKYPDVASIQIGGSSFEKRSIYGLKISHKKGNKGILIEAGMHGNDWMGSLAATYIINQLVNPQNKIIRDLVEKFDWYIFPHINPDGYIYSQSMRYARPWRKNRSKVNGDPCLGVELNSNWGFHWGELSDEDMTTCSPDYPGLHAFSEAETRSFSEYLSNLRRKIHIYIALHVSNQLILYPYGYSSKTADSLSFHKMIMEAGIKGFASRYGTEYKGGSIFEELYPWSGSSVDWVHGTGLVGLAFQIHLRTPIDRRLGFRTNETELLPICEETMDGIASMANEAVRSRYFSFPFRG